MSVSETTSSSRIIIVTLIYVKEPVGFIVCGMEHQVCQLLKVLMDLTFAQQFLLMIM